MLGRQTGSTYGLRTVSGLWIEEERTVAVEARCWGGGGDWWIQRKKENGKTSLTEKHSSHSRLSKDNFFI